MLNKRPSAREELLAWAKARDFRERANEYLNRARHEPDGDVQSRFVDIARHYRMLAEAEASNAGRMGNERRAEERVAKPLLNIIPALVSSPKTTGRISNLMLDPLTTAEIQALRLKLQLFASRQTDATVRSQCVAVDTRLAEVLEGDDPILREVLANSVEQLEEALRRAARSTIEMATAHFLTGLRRRGSLSA